MRRQTAFGSSLHFFFVITTLLTLFVRASRFLSFRFSPALAFVAPFPSAVPPHPRTPSVCLSKHQISSLGETLEDSPSVYK